MGPAFAMEPPSRYGVDAPELALLGPQAVGLRTLELSQSGQVDVLSGDASPVHDRRLLVDLWYPARSAAGAQAVVYSASFPAEPPAGPVSFSVPGIAMRDAKPAGTQYPWVLVSHGYSNDPAAMTWLTENLASKGYVVAAIHHDDPPITDRAKFVGPLLRRPLDIAFVAQALRQRLGAEHLVDPNRLALVGYSMGGYGVLTAAGAALDPAGPPMQMVPGGAMKPYAHGATQSEAILVKSVRAVVAISPAGGGTLAAWGSAGLRDLTMPLLFIAGDSDRTVDYASGARAFFDGATNAPRFLLTFKGGGHAIGLSPVPDAMRARLWDQDWFEDPVWRKDRVNAINAHFITAFLDRYLKDDESRATYLEVSQAQSALGVWQAPDGTAYAALSPGGADVTLWKGFQRNHAAGLELLHAAPVVP